MWRHHSKICRRLAAAIAFIMILSAAGCRSSDITVKEPEPKVTDERGAPEAEPTGQDEDVTPEAESTRQDEDVSPEAEPTGQDEDVTPEVEPTRQDEDVSPEAEPSQPEGDDPEAESDIERLAGSVVRLEVYDRRDNRIGSGSGFAAFTEPVVLVTARHVVVNMDHMIATRDDGSVFRIESIIEDDEDSDVAICALPEDAYLAPLEAGTDLPARGSDCMVIGSQFGLTNLVTKGNICGVWETDKTDWLLFTAPVSGGSSGGPVFDENGNVTGIVTGTYDKGQNLNLAAPFKAALKLHNIIRK